MVIERLDDQFLFAFQRIDNQAVLPFSHCNDQHKKLGTATGFAGLGAQAQQRQNLIPQLQYLVIVDLVHFGFTVRAISTTAFSGMA